MKGESGSTRPGRSCGSAVTTEIDGLVETGFLKPERRHDRDAVESAINSFICRSQTACYFVNRSHISDTRSLPKRSPPARELFPGAAEFLALRVC